MLQVVEEYLTLSVANFRRIETDAYSADFKLEAHCSIEYFRSDLFKTVLPELLQAQRIGLNLLTPLAGREDPSRNW